MTGEVSYFRKRFLGGFNREDVIDYIEKLALERNRLQEEKDRAEHRLLMMTSELETLRIEIEQARTSEVEDREKRIAAVNSALSTFSSLETTLGSMGEEITRISERAREELRIAREGIAEFPAILEKADEKYAELLTVFEYEDSDGDETGGFAVSPPEGASYDYDNLLNHIRDHARSSDRDYGYGSAQGGNVPVIDSSADNDQINSEAETSGGAAHVE